MQSSPLSNSRIFHRLVAKSCLTPGDPMDWGLPGSSVHGILQAGILEWVAFLFSKGSSQLRDWTRVSCLTGRFFTYWAIREAQNVSCSLVSDSLWPQGPIAVHGILQARILEWVAMPFSRGYSWPRDRTHVSCTAGGFFTIWATREAQDICITPERNPILNEQSLSTPASIQPLTTRMIHIWWNNPTSTPRNIVTNICWTQTKCFE